jgi:hypothetical protein
MEIFEMVICIYKNWPNDACVGGFHSTIKDEYVDGLPFTEKFTKMEKTLMDKYEDVIVSLRLLDLEDDKNKLLYILFLIIYIFQIFCFFNFDVHICQSSYIQFVVFGCDRPWNDLEQPMP